MRICSISDDRKLQNTMMLDIVIALLCVLVILQIIKAISEY